MRNNRTWLMVAGALALGSAATFMVTRSFAAGIPATGALTYTGILLNPDGTGVSGSKSVGIVVYDAQTAGNQVCNVPSASVTLSGGRFQVALPDACTTGVNAHADLWVEVAVDGVLLGRTKLGAVPYAVQAGHTIEAETLTAASNPANDAQWMLLHAAAAAACVGRTQTFLVNGGTVVPRSGASCDATCAAISTASITYTCEEGVAIGNIRSTRITAVNQSIAGYYAYGCGANSGNGDPETPTAGPSPTSGLFTFCCCMA